MDLSPFGGAQGPVAFVFHDGGTTPARRRSIFPFTSSTPMAVPKLPRKLCAAETGGRVRVHVDELPDIFDVRWQDSALCCDGAPGQLFVLPRTLRPDLGHASLRWLLTGSCANGAGMWRKTTRRGGRSCQELGRDSAGNGLRGCVRAWVSDRSARGSGGRRGGTNRGGNGAPSGHDRAACASLGALV